jgi:predicted dehydrogenase
VADRASAASSLYDPLTVPTTDLTQAWPRPTHPRPIVIIGAGGIVRSAHLPVYRALGFPVAGLFDVHDDAARSTADAFAIETVFPTLAAAAASGDAIFDLAVPGDQILGILEQLPRGAAVLIQKPMGPDLAAARAIRACCRDRDLTAAVNLQLRFSPNVLALRDLLTRGALGALVDVEVRIVIDQPWHLWPFLETAPRLEVPYHSIHYLDAIRWLAGEPSHAHCRVVRHPSLPRLADTRSSIILDYGDHLRCSLTLNHTHRAGPRFHTSEMTIEGLDGAARLTWGVNLDYPTGPPDTMEIARDGAWADVPLRGSWFTAAFEGPMSNLQRVVSGEDRALVSPVDDALRTMAVVEACYTSSTSGGTPIPPTA